MSEVEGGAERRGAGARERRGGEAQRARQWRTGRLRGGRVDGQTHSRARQTHPRADTFVTSFFLSSSRYGEMNSIETSTYFQRHKWKG